MFRRGSPAVSAPSSIGWWSDCDRAFDIVNLRLDVPTLKGAPEKTPSFMRFAAFYRHRAGRQAGAKGEEMTMDLYLDPKTQLLVAIGAAVAAKCQNCFVTLYGTANKVGATDKEIGAAVAIATKVTAKSHEFMAAFIDETTKGKVPAARTGDAAASVCGCS